MADTMRYQRIRNKIPRFRILIMGRANAGKTTILQRVCKTTEAPEVIDRNGNKINLSIIEGTRERGEHDIENELVFRSNHGFVFHDSCGFESGKEDEFNNVKNFILERSKEKNIGRRIHAIWYCIPMTEIERTIMPPEEWFFNHCGSGDIPVLVLFTKFDALLVHAIGELDDENCDASLEALPARAMKIFERYKLPSKLAKSTYPPKGHVTMEGMQIENGDCTKLMEETAEMLNDEVVEQMFVSTQQISLGLCTERALKRYCCSGLD
ncbi:GTP-binding protein [Amanita rubescens]|nr:GTP-binding protein [Amanita rubescens]